MRIVQNKGPFATIEIMFEPLTRAELETLRHDHARVTVLSHEPLDAPSAYRLTKKSTPNIHLDGDIDHVFGRFRDTVRNEVRRTQRMEGFAVGLPVALSDEVYQMFCKFEYAQHRAPFSRATMSAYQYAVATYHGRPISAVAFYRSGDIIRVFAIFSQRLDAREMRDADLYKLIGYASKRIIYELCSFGIQNGARIVDLASINLEDASKASIAAFKSGFGAAIEDEYRYSAVSPVYAAAERLLRLKANLMVTLRGK